MQYFDENQEELQRRKKVLMRRRKRGASSFASQGAVSPDVTAPTLSNATAGTLTIDGTTGAGVTTNENNLTLYWAVLTNDGSCTNPQLIAGSGGNIIAGQSGNQAIGGIAGAKTIPDITGLDAATDYEIVFLQVDSAGNISAQATIGFTTLSGAAATEPYLSFSTGLNSQYAMLGFI